MTDTYMPRRAYKGRYTRDSHGVIKVDGNLPSPEELDEAHARHKNDAADRFSLYTPEQVETLTKPVRWEVTFEDVIKVRDQCEMVMAACRLIMESTRKHDLGSIRQRIEARREAASLGAALSIFNGKTPYGYAPKKRRRD